MSIAHKYVTSADGTRLFAQAAGDPANPALVCVHGLANTSSAFRKQLASTLLLEHVYVVAYDLRGNGRSDMPEEPAAYEGKKMVEDFQAVCAAFGVTRPVLLGWSLGGTFPLPRSPLSSSYCWLAAILLLDILNVLPPSFLRGAVLVGAPSVTIPLHRTYATPWLGETLRAMLGPDAATASKAAIEFMDGCFARPQEVSYEDRVRTLGELALVPHQTRLVYVTAARQRDTSTFRERLKDVPILVIQGTEDKLIDVHKSKEVLDSFFSGQDYEWVWVEGAGHMPFWEGTAVHDEAVVKFVKRLTSV